MIDCADRRPPERWSISGRCWCVDEPLVEDVGVSGARVVGPEHGKAALVVPERHQGRTFGSQSAHRRIDRTRGMTRPINQCASASSIFVPTRRGFGASTAGSVDCRSPLSFMSPPELSRLSLRPDLRCPVRPRKGYRRSGWPARGHVGEHARDTRAALHMAPARSPVIDAGADRRRAPAGERPCARSTPRGHRSGLRERPPPAR
jgi:hypothetical protein